MLNKRCIIGAFVWRYEGLEACPCRILAFTNATEPEIEAVGVAARGAADVPLRSI
jgi:hypothetical protein